MSVPSRIGRTALVGIPVLSLLAFAVAMATHPPTPILIALGVLLIAAVFTAVHHAELIAARLGEPFGSLVLALSVTVAEGGMILTLMLSSPETTTTLARDAVFAAIMLICNGIVGVSLILKSLVRRTAVFNPEGVSGALAAIAVLTTLTLVFPSLTHSAGNGLFSPFQLTFVAVVSLVLYLVFVFVQTIRHRDFFVAPEIQGMPEKYSNPTSHEHRPSKKAALKSVVLLLISLVSVVGLAEVTTPVLKSTILGAGLPIGLVAVSISFIVLLPEAISAIRAAVYGRSQTSLNLAYGSAMATIGLTIPLVSIASLIFGLPLVLGLGPSDIVLLMLTIVVSILTVIPGKATVLQGAVHLCILGGFLVFVLQP